MHIVVVDDEPGIRTMLRRYLTEEGFCVSEAAQGSALRDLMAEGTVDLILMDLMLGAEDGLSLAREVRRQSDVPIIILTGKGDIIDRVVGLESGADDYIAKPFHLREVLARIRTVMRRIPAGAAAPSSPVPPPAPVPQAPPAPAAPTPDAATATGALLFDGWRLDLLKRELMNPAGQAVPLTTGEFELLRAFTGHPNRVLNRDQLMDLVKGRDWAAYDRAIDTQVVRLRRKIETDPASPALIKTVRGAGYLFAATVSAAP